MRPRTCCCSLKTSDTDFLVKGNLRRQDPAEWLAEARRQTEVPDQLDRGPRAWYGETTRRSRSRPIPAGPANSPCGRLWRATKRFADSRWPAVDGTRD
ncbi:MAG: hypothetical protein U5K69_23975 [Balneolaceae bacterium]|nr:hypothetical protein [Balneolaceae bacterium]